MQRFSILSLLILALVFSNYDFVDARPHKNGDRIKQSKNKRDYREHRRMAGSKQKGPMSQLDHEQRTQLKQRLKSLRESGASPEAISQATIDEFTKAGIELPENFSERINQREHKRVERKPQREIARKIIKEMKAQGATRKEIRSALKEAGVTRKEIRNARKEAGITRRDIRNARKATGKDNLEKEIESNTDYNRWDVENKPTVVDPKSWGKIKTR